MQRVITEVLGTFLVTLTVTQAGGTPHGPLIVASMLTAAVYAGRPVSGAHYNPCATVGALMAGAMPAAKVFPYLLAQLVGAIAGAGIGMVISGRVRSVSVPDGAMVSTGIREIAFTFALVLTILCVAVSRRAKGNPWFGAAIGLAVLAGAGCGAVMNPAVAFGLALIAAFGASASGAASHVGDLPSTLAQQPHPWEALPVLIIAPLIGTVLAAGAFRILERPIDGEAG